MSGQGYVADVRIRGRLTAVEEYGAICVYGVNPGGLAAGGDDMNSGYLDFKLRLAATLFDLASDAGNFGELREAAQAFIAATDDESVEEWENARRAIRAGMTPTPVGGLRRETEPLPAEDLNPDPEVALAQAPEVAA